MTKLPNNNENITDIISSKIYKEGPISLYDYMSIALYDKDYGYYNVVNPIGKKGDFITAPEIHQIFGEMFALGFISKFLEFHKKYSITQDAHTTIHIIEIGAGYGTLSYDIIKIFEKLLSKLSNISVEITIIEISKKLQEIQKIKLAEYIVKYNITWFATLNDFKVTINQILVNNIAEKKILYFIANELLDAFPIYQFQKFNNEILERKIGIKKNIAREDTVLQWVTSNNISKDSLEALRIYQQFIDISNLSNGSIIEVNIKSIKLLDEIIELFEQDNILGLCYFIDYGYRQPSFSSSIQSVFKHKYNNIFDNIGSADITSLVDFEILIRNLLQRNYQEANISKNYLTYKTQREALLYLGLKFRYEELLNNCNLSGQEKKDLVYAVKRLIAPEAMGELFKVLEFGKLEY